MAFLYHLIPEMARFHRPFMSSSGSAMSLVAGGHGLLQVGVLGLDHVVGRLSLVREVAQATELAAVIVFMADLFLIDQVARRRCRVDDGADRAPRGLLES